MIKATVSDGHHTCPAIFPSKCCATFQEDYGRSLAELKGCVFKILTLIICIWSPDGLRLRTRLLLPDIKWLRGRIAEPIYGSPITVNSKEPAPELVKTLFPGKEDFSSSPERLHGADPYLRSPSISDALKRVAQNPAPLPVFNSKGPYSTTDNNARPSPQIQVQLPLLPPAEGNKEIHREDKALQQRIRAGSSEGEIAPREHVTQSKVTAFTVEVTTGSGELPETALPERPFKGKKLTRAEDNVPWGDLKFHPYLTKIPRDQQALLDRPESWFPPEPGQRFPTANIPLQVLQQLNLTVERHVLRLQKKAQASRSDAQNKRTIGMSEDEDDELSSEASPDSEPPESDLDKPFPTAEWPPSSPRENVDALPPDSSDPLPSMEMAMQPAKSPSSVQNRQEEQPLNADKNAGKTDRLIIDQPQWTAQSNQSDIPLQRSLSEESVIEYTPPHAVRERPRAGQQMKIPTTSNSMQQPSSRKLEHKTGVDGTKRSAESPPRGTILKRLKAIQQAQRKSSSPDPSPESIDHKAARRDFYFNLAKSKMQNKPKSPTTVFDRPAQASATFFKSSPVRPAHTPRPSIEGDQEMHELTISPSVRSARQPVSQSTPYIHCPMTPGADYLQPKKSEPRVKPRSQAQSSLAYNVRPVSGSEPPEQAVDVFDRFSRTYPEYSGDRKHFFNLCRKLTALNSQGKAQHRSHWDDYIIRHKTEYGPYLLEMATEGEDPMPYEDYYREVIDEPLTRQRILGPATLEIALQQSRTSSSSHVTTHAAVSVEPETKAPAPMELPSTDSKDEQRELIPETEFATSNEEQRDIKMEMADSPIEPDDASAQHHSISRKPTGASQEHGLASTAETEAEAGLDLQAQTKVTKANARADVVKKEEVEMDGDASEIWKDYNAPFKEYARAYAELKSVRGRLGTINDEDGIVQPLRKRIDTLSWRL